MRSSSFIARLTSALCRSIGTFKRLERSCNVFLRSFVSFPWALKTLTTLEYASNSVWFYKEKEFYYICLLSIQMAFKSHGIKHKPYASLEVQMARISRPNWVLTARKWGQLYILCVKSLILNVPTQASEYSRALLVSQVQIFGPHSYYTQYIYTGKLWIIWRRPPCQTPFNSFRNYQGLMIELLFCWKTFFSQLHWILRLNRKKRQ